MEWWLVLLAIMGGLLLLLATGMPVAFAFMIVNIVGVLIFMGGQVGINQLAFSFATSITKFSILPVILFILMGELMFISGMAPSMMDVLDKWLGRLPGRLALLAVGGGTLFATLSGSTSASVAMLGSVLTPEMERRGYKKSMSLGPIIGSGGLAKMIPPSAIGVIVASIAKVPVGTFLIAIIVPGLLMALFYAIYIIIRCRLQPGLAPEYEVTPIPLSQKLLATVKYVLPLGSIVFLVMGLIFLGVATPSEAAALGSLGTFVLAAVYRKLNWEIVKKSALVTARVTVMAFMIIVGAVAFGQVLAISGATRGLIELTAGLNVAPIVIIIAMQLVILVMGCFLETLSMTMIAIPIFIPIVQTLGFSPMWFTVMFLLNTEMAGSTPPFGLYLFVMKGVAPPDTTMGDIYKAGLPFIYCDMAVLALLLVFPTLTLWLPGMMR